MELQDEFLHISTFKSAIVKRIKGMIWWVCMCQLNYCCTASALPLHLPDPSQALPARRCPLACRCPMCSWLWRRRGAYSNSRGIWMKRTCSSEKNITDTDTCFLGWKMTDVACKNVDTRRWIDLGWWYLILMKTCLIFFRNNKSWRLQQFIRVRWTLMELVNCWWLGHVNKGSTASGVIYNHFRALWP